MKRTLLDIWYTAIFELQVSLRSRRFLVVIALFVIASVFSSLIFVRIIEVAEHNLAEQLMVSKTEKVGLMIDKIKENKTFRHTIGQFIGNQHIVTDVLKMPLMVINYTWFVLTCIPFAIAYVCSETFVREVYSGSIRFVLFRTDLFDWVVGKTLGQMFLVFVALLCSMVAMLIVGSMHLYHFSIVENFFWMLRMSFKIVFYVYAFLGFSLMISMMFRNVGTARACSLIFLAILLILDPFLSYILIEKYPTLSRTLVQLLPSHHQQMLWDPNILHHSIAQLILFCIGTVYLFVGYHIFRRREK